jgi:parallel beta-helix repeat protein
VSAKPALVFAALVALTLVVSVLQAASASAATTTWWVDGGDSRCPYNGNGSPSAPFCTISAAAAVAQAGDSVLVKSGTYNEEVKPKNSGTPGSVIAYSPADGASVTVSGGAHGFTVDTRSWITISGFTVSGTTSYGIYLKSSSNITVSGNRVTSSGQPVSGATAQGIYIKGTTSSLVVGNTTDHNSDAGIYLTTGTTGVEIRGNSSYSNARGYTRAAPGIDVRAAGNTVDRNITYGNEDAGIQLYNGGDGSLVYDNLSYGNGDHGIDCLNSTGVQIISNTVYSNVTAGINLEGAIGTAASTQGTVRNNISVGNGLTSSTTKGDIRVDPSSLSGTTIDSDLLWLGSPGTMVTWGSTLYSSVATLRSATGQETNGLQADPSWVDPAGADFHLSSGSPAIDSADSGAPGQPATDLEGRARFDDPATANTGLGPRAFDDRGAFEFGSGSGTGPTAALSVSPGSGAPPLAVTADASGSFSADGGSLASFRFDFGDGSVVGPQPGATAGHTYTAVGTYHVTVTVTDQQGRSDNATATVVVQGSDTAPVARLSVSPTSGPAPLAVTADASASTDTDAWPIATYTFAFGDGTTVGPMAGATASHTYPGPGTFTVTVTVTDTAGLSSTATAGVSVSSGPPPNLVGNPGFETSTTGWNNNGRTGITLTRTSGGHSGSFAGTLANTTGSTQPDCTLNDSPNWVGTTSAGTYVASLWVRADTAGATLRLRLREYAGATFSGQVIGTVVLSSGWQQVSVSYVPSVPGGSNLDLTAYTLNAPPGQCFVADDASITVS